MPEGRAGAVGGALLTMAARRVRLLTIVVLVGAITLIAAHDASWTSIAIVGIAALAVATGCLGIAFWLRARGTAGGRRES
jgi:Na+-transporting NADH:ubiquinone oxidoreductase subunit NqrB